MSETSTSSNSSRSTSSSSPVQTTENAIMNQISSVASGMAQQLYSWAQSEFAKTSAVTDQAVNNFFQTAVALNGLANTQTTEYNNLVAEANAYASPAHMAADMGMAGATQAQAGAQAEQNSRAQLEQYGIDPSSGRYAGLINADQVQNAANVAGAENTQRVSDITTGQNLRASESNAATAIANTENAATSANTGAVNAELANANTGANMFALPNSYLGTAMGIKMPFNAQSSQSASNGMGNSQRQQPQQPQKSNNGSGQNPSGGPNSGGANSGYNGMTPNPGPSMTSGVSTVGGSNDWGGGVNADALGGVSASDFTGGNIYNTDPNAGTDLGFGNGSQSGYMTQGAQGSYDSPTQFTTGDNGGGVANPFGDTGFGQTYDYGGANGTFGDMGGGTNTEFGNISYDPSANQVTTGWNDPSVTTNYSSPVDQSYSTSDYGGGDYSSYDPNTDFSGNTDYSSGYSDYGNSDYSGGDSSFARGGPVPPRMRRPPTSRMPNMMASGGQVPASASPSGGQNVDDVRAQGPGQAPMRLNANEFVIPQDVALWKGQEFFQNLINDSRKKRMTPGGAPAKPTVKPMGVA